MRCSTIGSCQSAATSETAKHCWSRVRHMLVALQQVSRPLPFTFIPTVAISMSINQFNSRLAARGSNSKSNASEIVHKNTNGHYTNDRNSDWAFRCHRVRVSVMVRQTNDGHMDRHLSTAQSVVQAYGAGMLSPNSNHRNSERQISDTRPKIHAHVELHVDCGCRQRDLRLSCHRQFRQQSH